MGYEAFTEAHHKDCVDRLALPRVREDEECYPPEPYVSVYQHPDWLQSDQISTYGSLTGLTLHDAPSVLVARHIEHHLKEYRHIRRFIPHLDEQLLVKMWAKRHISPRRLGGFSRLDRLA